MGKGNVTELQRLLREEPGTQNPYRNTLSSFKNMDMLDGSTALMMAANNGETEAIQFLLSQGADPDSTNIHGYHALMFAAHSGHLDAVKALVAGGAHVNKESRHGQTALSLARRGGQDSVVSFLAPCAEQEEERQAYHAFEEYLQTKYNITGVQAVGGTVTFRRGFTDKKSMGKLKKVHTARCCRPMKFEVELNDGKVVFVPAKRLICPTDADEGVSADAISVTL